jgi:hypothetical protein
MGKEWDRNDTQERDKNHKRQGTGKNKREKGRETHKRGNIPLLLRDPNGALTARMQ